MKNLRIFIPLCALLLASCSIPWISEENENQPDDSIPTAEQQQPGEPNPFILFSDPEEGFIAFTGRKGEKSEDGRFREFQFQMILDQETPEDLSKARLGLAFPVQSLLTKDEELTSYLLSENFFDSANFPLITFFSSGIEAVAGVNYIVTGDLMVRDTIQQISFPAEITNEYVTLHYVLSLSDFGLGESEEYDDEVPVDVEVFFQE